jgi:apolipoprotein N-acyltransferase
VAIEFWWPRVFPWKLAYTQLEFLPLVQIADLAGPAGISFVVTAVATVPAALLLRSGRLSPPPAPRGPVIFATGAAALLLATLSYGQVTIWQWSKWIESQPKLRIGLIQVDPTLAGAEVSLRERSLAIHDQVDLICWPESSLGTYCERLTHFRDRGQTQRLSRDSREALGITQGLRCFLLAGAKSYADESDYDCPYDVVAFLISPDQEIVGRYHKQTLLPLGEYIPGERLFPLLRQWADLNQDLQTGDNPAPLTMGEGKRLGVLICYEDTLVSSARKTVERDADVLFCLINAAAFENPLTLKQHLRLAALRAVENRRYFARCASTGITCIIDPLGKVVSQLPVEQEGTLTADVCLVQGRTVFNRLGDALALVCTTIITLAALAYCTLNRRG